MPSDVCEWVRHLTQAGVSPTNIRTLKSILGAVFMTALNDQVTFLHPCKGVKTPTVAPRLLTVVTPEQFDILYQALPGGDAQLLVETAIESGLRWGELAELRPRDLNPATCMLTISRVAVEVNPKFHPDGQRFLVKDYPKGKRAPPAEAQPADRRQAPRPRPANGLGPDDLFFTMVPEAQAIPRLTVIPNPAPLGLTEPNDRGRRYLTARSALTTPGNAGAYTAKERSLPTGLRAGPLARTSRGSPGSPIPMGTFPAGGSASTSGCRRSEAADLGIQSGFMICVTRMRHGFSPVAPICGRQENDSGILTFQPRKVPAHPPRADDTGTGCVQQDP